MIAMTLRRRAMGASWEFATCCGHGQLVVVTWDDGGVVAGTHILVAFGLFLFRDLFLFALVVVTVLGRGGFRFFLRHRGELQGEPRLGAGLDLSLIHI